MRGGGIFKEIWGTGPVQVETFTSYGKLSFRKWVLVLAKLTEGDGIVGQYVSGRVVQLFRKDRLMRRRSLRSREEPALVARETAVCSFG